MLGAAVQKHPSYGAFLPIGLLTVYALDSDRSRRDRNKGLTALGGPGFLIVLPWLLPLLQIAGLGSLRNAAATHGALELARPAVGRPADLVLGPLSSFANLGNRWSLWLLAESGLIGVAYAIVKGRYLLPLWLLLPPLALGETARFEELIAAALTGYLIVELAASLEGPEHRRVFWRTGRHLLFFALALTPFLYQGAKAVYGDEPALNSGAVEAAAWLRDNTPQDAAFLLVPNTHALAEWMPYLSRRPLAIAHWGAEWTGAYADQQRLQARLEDCGGRQSLGCLEELSGRIQPRPRHLMVNTGLEELIARLAEDGEWIELYRNEAFIIYGARGEGN